MDGNAPLLIKHTKAWISNSRKIGLLLVFKLSFSMDLVLGLGLCDLWFSNSSWVATIKRFSACSSVHPGQKLRRRNANKLITIIHVRKPKNMSTENLGAGTTFTVSFD